MEFRYHPDGRVWLGVGFQATLEEFQAVRPGFSPGAGAGILYDGVRHIILDNGNQRGGPVPWPEGDDYLANAESIKQAIHDNREAARLAEQQAKADAEAARRAALTEEQRVNEDINGAQAPRKLVAALVKAVKHLRLGTPPPQWVIDVLAAADQRIDAIIAGRNADGTEG